MPIHRLLSFPILLLCAAISMAHATVRLPKLVGAHMVLQRGVPLPLWGWAAPGEAVSIVFRGKTYQAKPGAEGRWQAILPAQTAGGPFTMLVQGQNTLELTDVLVGDVWLAAGQSNMQFKVKDNNPHGYQPVQNADQEIAAANYPDIRMFTVAQTPAYRPATEVMGSGWQVNSPATVADFSAVAYFFGREIHQQFHVPIGLLVSSWGGTPAEAWMSAAGLQAFPEFQPQIDEFRQQTIRLADDFRAVPKPVAAAKAPNAPTDLYNGMIAPLLPFALKGIIWYQGETNVGRAAQYRTLFPGLITDWRAQWGQSLPFLFVQLANYKAPRPEPTESDWAELREAQAGALRLPATGMATTIDIGEAADIHPHNKQAVGHRLALVARHVAYGDKMVVFSGPVYTGMAAVGSEIRLKFTHYGSGLTVKNADTLRGFAVAGADHKFYWATARLEGNEVWVSSKAVPQPAAVRYNWADNPNGNLYNQEGLPAVPFRTDAWLGGADTRK